MDTLILTSKDLKNLIHEEDSFQVMEQVFRAHGHGKTQMPAKIYLDLKKYHGDFRAMPAYVESPEACGLKWVNSHPRNINHGFLPAVMGILILNDPQTGFPYAILDGTFITRERTGASGALASSYLARAGSKILALVGCGVQAEAQFKAHINRFRFSEIRVWGPTLELSRAFSKRMDEYRSKIIPCEHIENCIERADIICTTTPSRSPLVMKRWLKKGVHVNAIGADAQGKQELESEILCQAVVIVDEREQSMHGGEVNVPFQKGIISEESIHATLGEIVCGFKRGRENEDQITVFDSTGLAIQDVALGSYAYQKALEQKTGQQISFFK